MTEQNPPLGHAFLAGKIISNFGQSTIERVVRRISDHGATIEVDSPLGIPKQFHLFISGEGAPRPCELVWQSGKEVGLEFEILETMKAGAVTPPGRPGRRGESMIRAQMLALRSALDDFEIGVVLLDSDLRA